MYRVMLGQRPHDNGVARLVIGGQLPLLLGNDAAVLLRPGNDLDHRLVDAGLIDGRLVLAAR